jgi:hypothetical protein
MGGAAVELLASLTSFDTTVNQYWKARAPTGGTVEGWNSTFKKVDGMSVAEFYATFEKSLSSHTVVLGKVN